MSDESPALSASSPGAAVGYPSLRSVIIGCMLCAITGLAGPYWTVYLQSSRLYADYHTAGATFFLFVLFLVFNVVLRLAWRPMALRTDELMTIGAMLLVGGSIVSSGLIAYLIPSMSSAYNLQQTYQWQDSLLPHMPKILAPLDYGGGTWAITEFWTGLQGAENVPWAPWLKPLAVWGLFLMALFACMMAIMTIMRKQWMDYEHLSYPIAQVPAELCLAAGDPLHRASIFRSTAFWIGLGVTFLLASIGGITYYVWGTGRYFRLRAWIELGPSDVWNLALYVEVAVVGLVFLIPNRVAFTVWFVTLLSWFTQAFMTSYNLRLRDEGVFGSEMNSLALGGTLVFVASSLWLSREHLGRALRCAFGRGEAGYDRGEPSTYRTAFIVVAVTSVFTVVWLCWMGLGLVHSTALMGITLAVYYAMARVVAQCGLPMLSPPIYPHNFMATVFGPGAFTAKGAAVIGGHMGWHFDMRNSVMSGSGHGMYLVKRRRSGLFWAMLAGLVVSYVAACYCSVWMGYRHGAANMDPWFYGNFPRLPWMWAQGAMAHHGTPSFARMGWSAVGAVIMAGLVVAQRAYFWWPIHPVGVLICSSHMVKFFWFSVFLAWLIKVLLLKFGGQGTFRPARRFFIGVVMGYFLAGGTWAIVDAITGRGGNAVFYI